MLDLGKRERYYLRKLRYSGDRLHGGERLLHGILIVTPLNFAYAPGVGRAQCQPEPALKNRQAARFFQRAAKCSRPAALRLAGGSKLMLRVSPSAEAARWRESSVTPVRVGSSRR